MIPRDEYLKKLIDYKNNGMPKVITGIRRCGKSTLLNEIYRKYLLEHKVKSKNILYMDLTDTENAKYCDPIYLNEYIQSRTKDDGSYYYVFLDEIQNVYSIVNPNLTDGKHILAKKNSENVISFVNTVLSLSKKKNIDLYITGSNSKMLSTDIITEFRDKAVNIQIAPLSFEEFYSYKGGFAAEALYEYMMYGGMPLAVLNTDERKPEYLRELFATTYFKDIIERNNLKRSEALDSLCKVLSECTGNLINANTIANTFKTVTNENIYNGTVETYINYFKDSFILNEATRYDLKRKKEIGALRKYYFCDTGLRNAALNFAYTDEGQLLENIVYNELVYNGYTVNIGTFERVEKDADSKSVKKIYEIDFIARKGIREYYIQVSSDISSEKTKEREIKPFIKINSQIQKIVVINRPVKEYRDENGFTIIGITDFLLRFIK